MRSLSLRALWVSMPVLALTGMRHRVFENDPAGRSNEPIRYEQIHKWTSCVGIEYLAGQPKAPRHFVETARAGECDKHVLAKECGHVDSGQQPPGNACILEESGAVTGAP